MSTISSLFHRKVTEDKKVFAQVSPEAEIHTMSDDFFPDTNTVKPMKVQGIKAQTPLRNPFETQPSQQPPTPIPTPLTKEPPKKLIYQSLKQIDDSPRIILKSSFLKKTSTIVLTFLLLAGIGGGYYYFMVFTPNTAIIPQDPSIITIPHNSEMPLESSGFSFTNPNYLPLDIENTSPEAVQEIFIKMAQEAVFQKQSSSNTHPSQILEFFVTDTANNPLSFTKFAQLSGIIIPPAVVETLNDTFSVFLFLGEETPKMGLFIETKNTQTTALALTQEENFLATTLPLSPIFLGDIPTKINEVFQNNTYMNTPIRFINIHPETKLSIDYSLQGSHLLISTSRDAHYASLEKINR